MRLTTAPLSMNQVTMCIALIFGPYVIRHLYIDLAVVVMSDSAVEIDSGSDIRTVEEHVLHHVRFVCANVTRNMKMSRVGVLFGFCRIVLWFLYHIFMYRRKRRMCVTYEV